MSLPAFNDFNNVTFMLIFHLSLIENVYHKTLMEKQLP